jgi:hypothetical protein
MTPAPSFPPKQWLARSALCVVLVAMVTFAPSEATNAQTYEDGH